MSSASNNTFSGNNFIDNTDQIEMEDSVDITTYVENLEQNSIDRSQVTTPDNSTIINQTSSQQPPPTNSPENASDRVTLDFPSVNFWDNGTGGNYWSNYTGVDSNGDRIGDTSHIINKNNQDNYPRMNPNIIPEFPDPDFSDDKKPAETTQYLIIIAVSIVLAIIFGVAIYKRKKIVNQQTPFQ